MENRTKVEILTHIIGLIVKNIISYGSDIFNRDD